MVTIISILGIGTGIILGIYVVAPAFRKALQTYRKQKISFAAKNQYYKTKVQRAVDSAFISAYYNEASKDAEAMRLKSR